MGRFYSLLLMLLALPAWAEDQGSADTGLLAAIKKGISDVVMYVRGVFDSIKKAIAWFGKVFVEVFKAAWDMLTDAFVWLFDSLFKLAAAAINGLDDAFKLSELAQKFADLWYQIPPETVQLMQAIGVPSALGIVCLALVIRFALQLIPFVRLGS